MRQGQPNEVLPVGKLPLEHLRSLLKGAPKHDPRLLSGPQIGEDAAVIDAGDRFLAGTVFVFTSLRAASTTIRLRLVLVLCVSPGELRIFKQLEARTDRGRHLSAK
jgi:hypothetical protein